MKKIIYRILTIICIGVFAFSAYNLYEIYSERTAVDKEVKKLEEHVIKETDEKKILEPDWESLKAENADIVGWVYVPGCDISFPIVQGDDNSYYLNHTTANEYNIRGSIFMDTKADPTFADDNTIIYGHSVDTGGMFTSIKNFSDSDFFNEHPDFYILTEQCNYVCHIYTYAKALDGSVYYTTDFGSYREDTLNEIKNSALYSNDIEVGDSRLVTLSTCDLDYGFSSDHRLILTGVMEQTDESIVLED